MTHPLVSVLVTVYNKGRYIRETLESVVHQTYQNWEMIVTDDRSSDNSRTEIQQVVDSRIRRVWRISNSGLPSVLRNEMIKMARGKYVAFLDGDDVWLPSKLERQIEFMEQHPEYPFTHVACMVTDQDGNDLYARNFGNYPPNGDYFEELLKKCFICTSSVMVARNLLQKVGGFSEDKVLKNNGEDWEFFLRCAKKHLIGMPGNEILMKYRWDTQSLSHHPKSWKPGLDLMKRSDLWRGKISRKELEKILWQTWLDRGFEMRVAGRRRPAIWYAGKMICLKWWRIDGWKMLLGGLLKCS